MFEVLNIKCEECGQAKEMKEKKRGRVREWERVRGRGGEEREKEEESRLAMRRQYLLRRMRGIQ